MMFMNEWGFTPHFSVALHLGSGNRDGGFIEATLRHNLALQQLSLLLGHSKSHPKATA